MVFILVRPVCFSLIGFVIWMQVTCERIIVVRLEIEPCVRIASTVSVICSARD
ncbi:hypothetical protein HanOQP8_Chr13g0475871 [Helianthus annuus]|nr:hypothetical protein HanOQP8_Chr13g0475871 [Helianthus annuus]